MKKILFVIASVFIMNTLSAQVDTDAMAALDKVANKMKTSKAWKIDFKYIISNKKDNSESEQDGSITLKGDLYILEMLGNVLYFDGKKNYNYIKDVNEVNIMPPEDNTEELFFTSPSTLFTFFKEGYKSKYTGQKKIGNETLLDIDLFPKELNKEYFRINILIIPESDLIRSFTIYNKNGVKHEIILTQINAIEMQDSQFTFNPENFPDVEVIDMTE